eukprot:TRINITY_DN6432_c0_g1_i1.p1 TRINITY_DN6432_c0_g1~~TRINITY_DN6432_c0_g1_i1.p1  ORF type:complete len:441 (+),score=99.31 TRINITY_DN6432_c0_g1_i1:101-1324(+)
MATEDPSVTLFREYLRIKTVHPNPDYPGAMRFLKAQAERIGLEFEEFTSAPNRLNCMMTWKGSDPSLPTILLNSHTDVVPVVQSFWKCDAFEAHKDEDGNIFARGTQDMKCVTIQHLEAVHRLKKSGFQPLRTIRLTFVADEEVGGQDGMAKFVETEKFRSLNVGLALDEGLASPDETFTVFYGERVPWWIKIKATGPTGHGSRFIENTAMEKIIKIVNRLLNFRKEQFEELQQGICKCGMKLGDVTTLNLTALKGGVTSDGKTYQLNVIPNEAEAGFDIRIPPTVDLHEFRKQLDSWIIEEGVTYEFVNFSMVNPKSDTSDDSFWWKHFKGTLDRLNCKIDPQIFPAATDSRFIRNKGIPAFGFSPMNFTPTLLHDHNEFLNEKIFLKGIDIFVEIVRDLASAKAN